MCVSVHLSVTVCDCGCVHFFWCVVCLRVKVCVYVCLRVLICVYVCLRVCEKDTDIVLFCVSVSLSMRECVCVRECERGCRCK